MNTDNANKYLDGFQIKDRIIYNSQDTEHPLDCLLEDYHQEQLKILDTDNINKQREMLVAYAKIENGGDKLYQTDIETIENILKRNL